MKSIGLTGEETKDALALAVLMKAIVEEDLVLVVAWDPYGEVWCASVGADANLEPDQAFGSSPLEALTQAARESGVDIER